MTATMTAHGVGWRSCALGFRLDRERESQMDNQAVVTAQHRQEEDSHPLHHNACPGAGVGRAAPHVGRGQGKPYGAAPCIAGMPGGPVMHMRVLARGRVITGNGLWASMTRSLRVDLMRLR